MTNPTNPSVAGIRRRVTRKHPRCPQRDAFRFVIRTSALFRHSSFVIRHSPAGLLSAFVVYVGLLCAAVGAQDSLLDQNPFDQITLDAENNHAVLQVLPLDLPDRRSPQTVPPGKKLQLRLVKHPQQLYEVLWEHIDEIKTYEQLLLAEARQHVKAGKFDIAYDFFAALIQRDRDLPGLAEAFRVYLFEHAESALLRGALEEAWGLALELHRRDAEHHGLTAHLEDVVRALFEERIVRRDFPAVRAYLKVISDLDSDLEGEALSHVRRLWTERLKAIAREQLESSESLYQAGKYRLAHNRLREARAIWPDLDGMGELADSIRLKFHPVVVGVTEAAPSDPRPRIDDWAGRRVHRLLSRSLIELTGYTAEGPKYDSPFGRLSVGEDGRRLSIHLQPDQPGHHDLTGYDVARWVLAMTGAHRHGYRSGWSQRVRSVSVQNVYDIETELNRPHVGPAALLKAHLRRYDTREHSPRLEVGPYRRDSTSGAQVHFVHRPQYLGSESLHPQEIVERHFADSPSAIRALRDGRIDVLDRVPPWTILALRQDPNIVVQEYALPTIHTIIPNLQKWPTSSRDFRRALTFAIHRARIPDWVVRAMSPVPGLKAMEGIFPIGRSRTDPISYAAGLPVKPRPYDPRLAMTLQAMAIRPSANTEPADFERGPDSDRNLVLAHPAEPVARSVCQEIRRQLQRAGIQTTLKEEPNPTPQDESGAELRYAELALWDPAVDANEVFGESPSSPHMSVALRQLDDAETWNDVRLQMIHVQRAAHLDVTLIPLWQSINHFASHRRLQGVGEQPMTLYENVEDWRVQGGRPDRSD